MLKVALRGLRERKFRTLLTSLAVVLGVALVAGTFVFTDTIQASFDDLISETQAGTDVKVLPAEQEVEGNEASTLPASIVDRVRGVDGVEEAAGVLMAPVAILDQDGERVGAGAAPSFALSAAPERFDAFEYDGRAPRSDGEVAIDRGTADKADYAVGDRVRVAGNGPAKEYDLVGIGTLGDVGSIGGASVAILTLPELQRIAELPGRISEVDLAAAEGTTPERLRGAVAAVAGPGVEVRTGEEDVQEQTADIEEGLGFLTTALLVFGAIALLVGAFSIFNTFSITVAQRTREFAMLRTIGASRRQILRVVIAEGLLVGFVGSLAGLLLGIALAPGLSALFGLIGVELPSSGIVIAARTVIVALLVGTLVTLAASLAPALRATRIPPMAALTESSVAPARRGSRRRTIVGGVVTAVGVAVLCLGLFGGGGTTRVLSLLGVGALIIFFGVAFLAPLLVTPIAGVIGAPLERIGGVAGRIARGNAVRNPGRTAGTAAALMIGLALVSFTTIFAEGIKASFSGAFEDSITADLVVLADGNQLPQVPSGAQEVLREVPGVATASGIAFSEGELVKGDKGIELGGIDPATAPSVVAVQWKEGSNATLAELGRDGAAVEEQFAQDEGLEIGSRFAVRTPEGEEVTLRVRGTFEDQAGFFGAAVVPLRTLADDFGARRPFFLLADVEPGEEVAAVQRRATEALAAGFPTLKVQTGEEFVDDQVGQVDQIVSLFYALLSLAIIISLFGIVNTLALSIFERTRELGLLRAIGTSRRQVRRIVRGEAVITALIGGVLGLAIGIFFAVIAAQPLADEGFVLSFPVITLAVLLILTALGGVLAAVLPARRASRVDILRALQYE